MMGTASAFSCTLSRCCSSRPLSAAFKSQLCMSSTIYPSSTADGNSIRSSDDDDLFRQRSEILRGNSKLSLAPMMEYTDRHFRHLVRLVSGKTLLYTEMVAANAIAHERKDALLSSTTMLEAAQEASFDPSYLLRFLGQGHNSEGPSVLQLGGSDPDQLYLASKTVYEFNQLARMSEQLQPSAPIFCDYTALNLNCGCPSPKVAGKGCFGAALMQDAQLVKQLTTSMHNGSQGTIPITVKCRIGTDEGYQFTRDEYNARSDKEEYQSLKQFIETVASEGIVTDFQVHARIAVLGKNYSPADNRKVPPLRYYQVRRLAEEFPELNISLNGGIETLSCVKRELEECPELDGIMVGRGWMSNPWAFAMSDELLYTDDQRGDSTTRPKNRLEVLEAYGQHADYEEERWDPVKIRRFITKAASQLFAGEPNAKRYRITLDEIAGLPKKLSKNDPNWMESQPPLSELILDAATKHLSEEVLYRTPKESYEKILWDEEQAEKRRKLFVSTSNGGENKGEEKPSFVQEWQQTRKENEKKESDLTSM